MACPNHICGPANHGDVDTANMLGMISTVSFIAAGAGAAAGVVLFVVGKPRPTSAAFATPWVGPGSAGIMGRF
jgi:hypothetical protein